MKYYTLPTQVLTKIVFYNFLPKLREYNYARGRAPLLIYFLLRDIKVNIPKLIDFMLSKYLLSLNRNLPYVMILTHLFKHLRIDLSDEKAIAPSADINHILLKRMQASTRAHAQPSSIQP